MRISPSPLIALRTWEFMLSQAPGESGSAPPVPASTSPTSTRMCEQPSRQACDRCHGLKLRCPRSNTEKCSRCLRAGANCVFSPSNRGRRPAQSHRQGSHLSKWTSDRPSTVKLAPHVPNRLNTHSGVVDLQNQLSAPYSSVIWSPKR